jgi:hypothetical protein
MQIVHLFLNWVQPQTSTEKTSVQMESGGREARDRRLQTVSEMGLAGPMETPTQVSQVSK